MALLVYPLHRRAPRDGQTIPIKVIVGWDSDAFDGMERYGWALLQMSSFFCPAYQMVMICIWTQFNTACLKLMGDCVEREVGVHTFQIQLLSEYKG